MLNVQGEDGADKMAKSIEKEMTGEGAKMDRIDKLGKRDFAYNARKQASGFFVNYHFEAPPAAIAKIQDKLRLNNNVYMQHYQRA